MVKIDATTWKIEPHTEVKHAILRKYLDAWIPIVSKFKKANYIDGFSGPGRYSDGEEGSPIIAIKALIEHKLLVNIDAHYKFLFIEEKEDRCDNLRKELSKLKMPTKNKITYSVECGKFDDKLNEVLNFIIA